MPICAEDDIVVATKDCQFRKLKFPSLAVLSWFRKIPEFSG